MTNAESKAAAVLGRKGGRSKSEAKQNAARENGRKGGRPKVQWHVFNMDHYFSSHDTYKEAVFEAQCHLDTKRRPKRTLRGFYELHGENSQRDIATTETAARQGFEWAEQIIAAHSRKSTR